MKKKCTGIDHTLLLSEFKHTCRVMKLILSFLLLCVSTVFSENVSSQIARVNIVANKLSVKEIIKQIEDQTDYLFVYSNEKVDLSHRVSLNASDISVINVLNRIFENSDIGYAMEGNNILLMKKEAIRQQKGKSFEGCSERSERRACDWC